MKLQRLAAAAATGLLLASAPAGLAVAQDATEMPAPLESGLSDEKLQVFAVAYIEVNQIGQAYGAQLEAATDDEQRVTIQQEAQMAMSQAVDNTEGLTIEEYNTIFDLAQSDPAIAQQIEGHINELVQQQ